MVILSQFAFRMNIQFDQVGLRIHATLLLRMLLAETKKLGYVIKLNWDLSEKLLLVSAEVTPTFVPKGIH